jgi:hypothetical protein
MRVLQWERIGDRRVQLVVTADGVYQVTLAVIGPNGVWEDISLRSDARLLVREARARYAQRCAEQRIRFTTQAGIPHASS